MSAIIACIMQKRRSTTLSAKRQAHLILWVQNYDRQSQRHSDTHVVTKTPAITTAKTNGINCMQRANNHELNDKDSGDKGSDIMTTSGKH